MDLLRNRIIDEKTDSKFVSSDGKEEGINISKLDRTNNHYVIRNSNRENVSVTNRDREGKLIVSMTKQNFEKFIELKIVK